MHTLLIRQNRWLYGFGSNVIGQLGFGSVPGLIVPTRIDINTEIHSMGAGSLHSLILTMSGQVYSSGDNFVIYDD